jgi:hypothetical protein
MTYSEADLDAGADALRRHEQGGKMLRHWDQLPKATKDKWRCKAQAVLDAAGCGKLL